MRGRYPDPIFINGMFRTCTTWLFVRFRELPNTVCYYVPLSPILSDNTPKEASNYTSAPSLRHEPTSDYFLEYPGYPNQMVPTARDWTQHPFYMRSDWDDDEMEQHLAFLIDHAWQQGKVPVFKLNFGFLRGEWLKSRFGGVHIFTDRDDLSLRRSFDSFRGSLGWTWRDLVMTVGQNSWDPLFKPAAKMLGYHAPTDLPYEEARRHASRYCRTDPRFNQATKLKLIKFFSRLARQHAKKYADLTVADINNVGKLERKIHELTGLRLDLSSYNPKPKASPYDKVHHR